MIAVPTFHPPFPQLRSSYDRSGGLMDYGEWDGTTSEPSHGRKDKEETHSHGPILSSHAGPPSCLLRPVIHTRKRLAQSIQPSFLLSHTWFDWSGEWDTREPRQEDPHHSIIITFIICWLGLSPFSPSRLRLDFWMWWTFLGCFLRFPELGDKNPLWTPPHLPPVRPLRGSLSEGNMIINLKDP